jgi:monoamine oxidase
MESVLIVGGGLSGLVTANLLLKLGISSQILEANNQLGGRIQTITGSQKTPMEMGATWFWPDQPNVIELLTELQLGSFAQRLDGVSLYETLESERPQSYSIPDSTEPYFRVAGGTYEIIHSLRAGLPDDAILLNSTVTKVIDEGNSIRIIDHQDCSYLAKVAIFACPPGAIADAVQFVPMLPDDLTEVMRSTQTWMNGSVKFAVEYQRPFWREYKFSGHALSQKGLAVEIYDHCNAEESSFALMGFLKSEARSLSVEAREMEVLAQLTQYFGPDAKSYLGYHDRIWRDSSLHASPERILTPHQNNGSPLYQEGYFGNKLLFIGAETNFEHCGYMEGAILSAKRAVDFVKTAIGN